MHAYCPNCHEYAVLDDGYCQVCRIQHNLPQTRKVIRESLWGNLKQLFKSTPRYEE